MDVSRQVLKLRAIWRECILAKRMMTHVRRSLEGISAVPNGDMRPTVMERLPFERALIFAPHMDDEAIGCGGTLVKLARAGGAITVVFLTDGRYGDLDLANMPPEARATREGELIRIRKEEARRAASIIGISSTRFLDAEDSQLASTPEIQRRVRDILTEVNPDVVFFPFFLEEHPDHRAVSQILWDATEGTTWSFRCCAFEVWTPLVPNLLVDIQAEAEAKRRAMSVYASQLKDNDYIHCAMGLNAFRSITAGGKGFMEAFWSGSLAEYRDLFQVYMKKTVRTPSGLAR